MNQKKEIEILKIGSGKTIKNVPIAQIVADESKMQAREKISESKAKEYAVLMQDGIKFPPVEVFQIGADYVLADGFHRLHAMRSNGDVTTTVKLMPGGEKEALFHALGANSKHGLDRSNEDKRKAVKTFLTHKEFSLFSDRDIARHLGVSNVMVSKYRKELKKAKGESTQSNRGARGGRLRAKLNELEEENIDQCVASIRNQVVAASKLLVNYDDDFFQAFQWRPK